MRILIMPNSYLPRLGGLQTVTHNLAEQLAQKGHNVRVITNRYPKSLPVRETLGGITVERMPFLTPTISSLKRKRLDLFLASLCFSPSVHWRLHNIMRSFRPDVINVHFPDHQIPFVLSLCRSFDVRLVVSLHGHDIERVTTIDQGPEGNDSAGRSYSRFALNQLKTILCEADAVTACSEYLLQKATRVEPSIAAKGRVIHNGIDPVRFQDKTPYVNRRPYILAIGRLVHSKGFDMLLEAFAEVTADVDLIIAGDGEDQKLLEHQARRLRIESRTRFFGPARSEQIVELLNGCVVVAVPSRFESFGIVALEAIAAGKPVVATHVGGLAELLRDVANGDQEHASFCKLAEEADQTGARSDFPAHRILVEPNPTALAKGLNQALLAKDRGTIDCTDVLTKYAWNRIVDEYEAVMMN